MENKMNRSQGRLEPDRWLVIRKLGAGNFGSVYEIRKEKTEEAEEECRAALKIIEIPHDEEQLAKIAAKHSDEARVREELWQNVENVIGEISLVYKLRGHKNIVDYQDHRIIPNDGKPGWKILLQTELLTSLRRYIASHPIRRSDIIRLGIDICTALEVCREYGYVHCDIKPDNILVGDDGTFKLGDFGIAKTIRQIEHLEKRMIGTVNYMAPELFSQEEGAHFDDSIDQYSLGIVMYRLLNDNRFPFMEKNALFSKQELTRANQVRIHCPEIPAPLHADEGLARIVGKACSFNPKDRFSSPTAMKNTLLSLLAIDKETDTEVPDPVLLDLGSYSASENDTATKLPPAVLHARYGERGLSPNCATFNPEEETL